MPSQEPALLRLRTQALIDLVLDEGLDCWERKSSAGFVATLARWAMDERSRESIEDVVQGFIDRATVAGEQGIRNDRHPGAAAYFGLFMFCTSEPGQRMQEAAYWIAQARVFTGLRRARPDPSQIACAFEDLEERFDTLWQAHIESRGAHEHVAGLLQALQKAKG
jgi:hypothetical protein